jgi:hypothetical protein
MIKKFNAPCTFNGVSSPFTFWLSDDYKTGNHPLYFQIDWLSKTRSGTLDPKISEGIAQIAKISEENKISFEYLFMIAMDAALKTMAANDSALGGVSVSNDNIIDDDDEDEAEETDGMDVIDPDDGSIVSGENNISSAE